MGFETFMQIASGGESPDASLFPKDEEGNLLNAYVTDINDPRGIGYLSPGSYMGGPGETWHPSQYDFSGLSLAGSQDGKATFQDENGLTFKYDYRTDTVEGIDPNTARDLKQSNPDAYYGALATQLKNDYFDGWKVGHAGSLNELEAIKDVSPKAYYEAKLNLLGQQAGWYQGQNTTGGIAPLMKQAEELAPEAYKYGVAPEQMTSLVNQGFTAANRENATRIANEKASGGTMFAGLPQFAATTAAMFAAPALAGYLTPLVGGSALAGGAATGALIGGATGALNSAIGEKNIGEGLLKGATIGGVTGGVGGGISDAFGAINAPVNGLAGAGEIATEVGQQAFFDALASGANSSEAINAGLLAQSAAPATAADIYSNPTTEEMVNFANARPDPIQALTELQSMSPTELASALGPGAGEASSNVLEKITSKVGTNLAKSELAKLLTSPSSGATATGAASGTSADSMSQLANLLRPQAQTSNFIGQYKMNQNPFSFTSAGQTAASPGMYDVSGSNIANALRKA